MFDSIHDIIYEMIPAVSSETLKKFKRDINTYNLDPYNFTKNPQDELIRQGDIVNNIEFKITAQDGSTKTKRSYGMLLSHSCDLANRKKTIVFALCVPSNKLSKFSNYEATKNQRITNLMFLPTNHLLGDDIIVNFNNVTSVHSKTIHKSTTKNLISLNDLGNFLFLTKLTIHFFRIE